MRQTIEGQLEILESGTVYFHATETGNTLLRIQGLPHYLGDVIDVRMPGVQIDMRVDPITHHCVVSVPKTIVD